MAGEIGAHLCIRMGVHQLCSPKSRNSLCQHHESMGHCCQFWDGGIERETSSNFRASQNLGKGSVHFHAAASVSHAAVTAVAARSGSREVARFGGDL